MTVLDIAPATPARWEDVRGSFVPNGSHVYRPTDDRPSWVINGFFIHRDHRRRGIASALLKAAVDHAGARGATRIDAYPIDRDQADGATLFVGSLGMFTAAGFVEVDRVRDRPLVLLTGP